MEDRRYRRHGGFVWPLLLVTLGVILLLNNLNVVSWSIWDSIWRFWPVLLIAIGLDILFGRRSLIGSLIAFVLIALVIGGALWFAVAQTPLVTGQVLTTDRVVQELSDATSADVRISFGAGTLRLGALKESGSLIDGTVATAPGETVVRDFSLNGGVARFTLRNEGVPRLAFGTHIGDAVWNLDLSPSVPMALHVSTGVGESTLDLSNLQVTNLNVDTGVGEARLTLPAHGRVSGKVSGGIGQVIVTVPDGMAARIHATAGIGSVSPSSRFHREGRDYVVGNYASADDRIELDISGGIGQVVIR